MKKKIYSSCSWLLHPLSLLWNPHAECSCGGSQDGQFHLRASRVYQEQKGGQGDWSETQPRLPDEGPLALHIAAGSHDASNAAVALITVWPRMGQDSVAAGVVRLWQDSIPQGVEGARRGVGLDLLIRSHQPKHHDLDWVLQ